MTAKERESASRSLSRGRRLFYLIVLACALPLLYLLVFRDMRFFLVPSKSMYPTLSPNDHVLTLSAREYRRGDVIVLEDPDRENSFFVKRIIARGGETIAIQGGAVFINGQYASEPYLNEFIDYGMPQYTVPEDTVFVLGDNRNWSLDSHNWGADPQTLEGGRPTAIAESQIVGIVKYIYLPVRRSKAVRSYPLSTVSEIRDQVGMKPDDDTPAISR